MRTACGNTTSRIVCRCVKPSERAAARWLGCTDSMPARKTSATIRAVAKGRSRPSPDRGRLRQPRQLQRRDPDAEEVQQDDQRTATEQVDVERRRRSAAARAPRSPTCAASRPACPSTRMHGSAITRILRSSSIALRDVRCVVANRVPLKNVCTGRVPARRVSDAEPDRDREHDSADRRDNGRPACTVAPIVAPPLLLVAEHQRRLGGRGRRHVRRVLLEDGRVALLRQPLVLDLRERAVRRQRVDRLAHAGSERAALRQQRAELLRGARAAAAARR